METFAKLFGSLLALVYHCFDRIVIHGHLPLLTRPENIVHFFRTQLRHDLRKLIAHALLERDGHGYAYRLTDKGIRVALMFVLFHQRVSGSLANSLFHRQPSQLHTPTSKFQAAYHKADVAIQHVIDLLAA